MKFIILLDKYKNYNKIRNALMINPNRKGKPSERVGHKVSDLKGCGVVGGKRYRVSGKYCLLISTFCSLAGVLQTYGGWITEVGVLYPMRVLPLRLMGFIIYVLFTLYTFLLFIPSRGFFPLWGPLRLGSRGS